MDVIKMLKSYADIKTDLDILEGIYKDLKETVIVIKSLSDNDGMPHGSNISNPTEQAALRLAAKYEECEAKRKKLVLKKCEIIDMIMKLESWQERYIIAQHYTELRPIAEIAEDKQLRIAVRTAYNYHASGIKRLKELYKDG